MELLNNKSYLLLILIVYYNKLCGYIFNKYFIHLIAQSINLREYFYSLNDCNFAVTYILKLETLNYIMNNFLK